VPVYNKYVCGRKKSYSNHRIILANGVVSKDGLRAYIEIGAIENDDKNLNSTMYHAFLVLRK